jgi:electron transfer flavoprotein alpha/beta subunit
MPALLTIQTGINQPCYANLRAIKQASSNPMAVLGLADIGLDRETLRRSCGARRRNLVAKPQVGSAEMLDGSAAAARPDARDHPRADRELRQPPRTRLRPWPVPPA